MSNLMSTVSNPVQASDPVSGTCPECEGAVPFARAPLAAQVARCPGCGVELEVTSIQPLTLELAPQVQEDWGE